MKTTTVVKTPPIVVLVFAVATPRELTAALDEVAQPLQFTNSDPVEWCFPSTEKVRVSIRLDEGVLQTYREDERERIFALVGKQPSAVLKLALHWRIPQEGHYATRVLVEHLLGRFYGVADDRSGEDSIWTIEQIRNTKDGMSFPDKADVRIVQTYSGDG